MLNLEFNNTVKAPLDRRTFERIFEKFIKINKLRKDVLVSVAVVKDSIIRKLNKQYRGLDRATDVLSFSDQDADLAKKIKPAGYLGEIIISYGQVKKQAKVQKHSLNQEMAVIFGHGLVHLLGYDHKTPVQAKKMQAIEKKIMNYP